MKKVITAVFVLFFSQSIAVHAADGAGTIEEIMVCTGDHNQSSLGIWSELGLFRTSDGNWFGTWVNNVSTGHYNLFNGGEYSPYGSGNGMDSYSIYDTAKDAFFADTTVSVRANGGEFTVCGVTANFLHREAGDFIRLTK